MMAACCCTTSVAALETVLGVLGLSLADLFERPAEHRSEATRSRIPARDLLELISDEVGLVAIIAADLLKGKAISADDWRRLAIAAGRINRAGDHGYER